MTDYVSEVRTEKSFTGNVVIRFNGTYFAIRTPDSGLTMQSPFNRCLSSLVLNPTTIDIRKVTTTIASYSFKLIDRFQAITAMISGNAAALIDGTVEIWLGRSGTGMDFSEYFKLPVTRIKKIDFADNAYSFSSTEETDRINKPLYASQSGLAGDILAATTEILMRDDISAFPAAGFLKIENEFLSYASKNNSTKTFSGVIRGELSSTPADHAANIPVFQVETITDNPLNILLKMLISNGGGGSYDTLQDGLGIDPALIDIAGIEALRDVLFSGVQYKLSLYNIETALKFFENELLLPSNLRFNFSKDSKLSIVILDKAVFVEEDDEITEDSLDSFPKWSVDQNKIVNSLEIQWDYNEGTNTFGKFDVKQDAASIATYGLQTAIQYSFKGIKASLDGQSLIDDFASHLLTRIAFPTPEVTVTTHIDKSLQTIGDKSFIRSSQIPATDGTLTFASEMEIVSRAINFQTGDVTFKLAFTSFTGIRSCYIAPSDSIQTVVNQHKVTVPSGRGDSYQVGWVMRLWDNAAKDYTSDAINTITAIVGDTITFEHDFLTVLSGASAFRLKFCDYDQATESQKKYCFTSDDGLNFDDAGLTYAVTY